MNNEEYKFTCLACHVAFSTAEHQRNHYRTDWHRYNLKRKVAELAPVSAEDFAQRVLARQAADRIAAEEESLTFTCNLCNKTYAKENSYKNHVSSRKHRDLVAAADITDPNALLTRQQRKPPQVVPNVDQHDAVQEKIKSAKRLELTDCLFCTWSFASMQENLDHMTDSHSFFIPDLDCLVDLSGLLTYLGEKIAVGNACLWCYSPYHKDHQEDSTRGIFHSLKDVQRHMIDKGHCKILYEDGADLEISDYYNFGDSAVSDDGNENFQECASEDEEDHQTLVVDPETNQLVLASGKALGHREYRTYYRQNLRNPPPQAETATINALAQRYQHLGVYASRIQREEQRTEQELARRKQHYKMQLGTKANKLQHHFRAQVMF